MTVDELDPATDPDLIHLVTGLRRTALIALELAVRIDPAILIIRDSEFVTVTADELRYIGIR